MELAYINIGLLTAATTFGLARFWEISDAAKLFVLLVALVLVENVLSLYNQLTKMDGIIISHVFLLIEGVLMATVFLNMFNIKHKKNLITFSILGWIILCIFCAVQDKNSNLSCIAVLCYTLVLSALSIHIGVEYLKYHVQRNILMQVMFIVLIATIYSMIFIQDLNLQIKWIQIICYGVFGIILYINRKNSNAISA